jgi:hypothetical protein
LVSVEEKVEVLAPLELVQESVQDSEKLKENLETARAKGWRWVLRERG